ncbi:50S ribosomal protein L25/general stress protein Ctc [Chroococcidiopsis sp. CCMEE 29]|uniref:50S ribosomal protein L25/general stress protein Ctc n=1 Tax=Chroococcidiopsis sp. CCMEE 29 TaxID=155894 RepID=UPI0020206B1E|nr:50S ribosomal protein L25/general stress protein Ctc [Chroococcidiopsis sp. CCMEE 29]
MELTIECQKREPDSKPRALRRAGLIPANLYGHNGTESISLTLDAKTVEHLLKQGSVNNTLVDLNITDIPWRGKTLLREVQTHPAKGSPYHLSFFAVAGHGDTDVEVPLRFVGEATGVKQEGGVLDTVITQLQVRCAPENIPDVIEINVSNLHVGDSINVENLDLPQGVTALVEPDQLIVSVLGRQAGAEQPETESESAGS